MNRCFWTDQETLVLFIKPALYKPCFATKGNQNNSSWTQCPWKEVDTHFNSTHFHLHSVSYVENTSIYIRGLVPYCAWYDNWYALAKMVGCYLFNFTCFDSGQFSVQFYYISCFVGWKNWKYILAIDYIIILLSNKYRMERQYVIVGNLKITGSHSLVWLKHNSDKESFQ